MRERGCTCLSMAPQQVANLGYKPTSYQTKALEPLHSVSAPLLWSCLSFPQTVLPPSLSQPARIIHDGSFGLGIPPLPNWFPERRFSFILSGTKSLKAKISISFQTGGAPAIFRSNGLFSLIGHQAPYHWPVPSHCIYSVLSTSRAQ